MILETKDLIIRPSRWEDIEIFYPWELEPAVTKFFSIRDGQTMEDVIKKYIDYPLPEVPANRPKKAYGKVQLTEKGGFFSNLSNLSSPVHT